MNLKEKKKKTRFGDEDVVGWESQSATYSSLHLLFLTLFISIMEIGYSSFFFLFFSGFYFIFSFWPLMKLINKIYKYKRVAFFTTERDSENYQATERKRCRLCHTQLVYLKRLLLFSTKYLINLFFLLKHKK